MYFFSGACCIDLIRSWRGGDYDELQHCTVDQRQYSVYRGGGRVINKDICQRTGQKVQPLKLLLCCFFPLNACLCIQDAAVPH